MSSLVFTFHIDFGLSMHSAQVMDVDEGSEQGQDDNAQSLNLYEHAV